MWATACQSTIAHETICSVIVAPKMVTCFFCCSVSLLTLCFFWQCFHCFPFFFVGTSYIDSLKPSASSESCLPVSRCQQKHLFNPGNLLFSHGFLVSKIFPTFLGEATSHENQALPLSWKPNPRKVLVNFLRFGLDDSWLLRFDRWFTTPRFELLGLFKGSGKLDMDIDHEHDGR